jgi:dihydroorotase
LLMLYYAKQGKLTLERVAEKMAHAPAVCFRVAERGFIREGYYADLVVVDLENTTVVTKSNILYKCGWSPLENFSFPASIEKTFVNGNLVYDNGTINDVAKGERLAFQL